MSFSDLGLSRPLLRAIADQGYTAPTPIQTRAIPHVLAGRDLLAAARTGTGKTAGFTLPLLERLFPRGEVPAGRLAPRSVRVLILTPTRELASQVLDNVRGYGRHLPVRACAIFGGVGMQPQVSALRSGQHVVVATPGRLLDHVGQGTIDLTRVETLVLDEADRMLDMGFIRDIRRILATLPRRRQNLLFSATFSDEIRTLAADLLDDPASVQVDPPNSTVQQVDQRVHPVARTRKRDLLVRLFHDGAWDQVLVFTRTKHGANRLADQLEKAGIRSAAIHGNKSQQARTRALGDFKAGHVRALVATDIAARGIDIRELPRVVNYELPNVPEDYVHRIGRTARAGATGEALSLVDADELKSLAQIERLIGRRLERIAVPGFDAPPAASAAPVRPTVAAPARHRPRPRSASGASRRAV